MARRYTKLEGLTELVRTRHEQGETYAEITPDHIPRKPNWPENSLSLTRI